MKIVIDIPKIMYGAIKEYGITFLSRDDKKTLRKLIANGTPLPKGHGRIIDYGYVVDAIDDWINAEEYKYTNATDYLRKRVKDISAIIEGSDSE